MIISITDEQWELLVRLLRDKERDLGKDWREWKSILQDDYWINKEETFKMYQHLEERDKRRLELIEDLLGELGA